mmetsp:Transcript_64512/g.181507  ORF Transcript_64512/g.181507 Transcript_64512/m.181507 type:complete len:125 (+) Transcript_64512:1-375(+)
MVDPGETAPEAAARELREETGFAAGPLGAGDLCYPDPWKSTESYLTSRADIDGDAAWNRRPAPRHEADENFAAVLAVPLSDLQRALRLLADVHGCKLEARTVGIAQGLALSHHMWMREGIPPDA